MDAVCERVRAIVASGRAVSTAERARLQHDFLAAAAADADADAVRFGVNPQDRNEAGIAGLWLFRGDEVAMRHALLAALLERRVDELTRRVAETEERIKELQ